MTASTRTSRIIRASPEAVYAAFIDPDALVEWLPPGDMTGKMHDFDARVGGGYTMSLFYPEDDQTRRGKTTEREDRTHVRFVELDPSKRIVETFAFDTENPALKGEVTLTATCEAVEGGTQVTLIFENLPPGVKPEDNDEGARLSLSQLASRLER